MADPNYPRRESFPPIPSSPELMLGAQQAARNSSRRAISAAFSRRRVPRLHRQYASDGQSSSKPKKPRDKFDFNSRPEDSYRNLDASTSEHINYKIVTANDLEANTEPPRNVKMLVRDYIEDALYNPNYGYFPKQATIFTGLGEELDFSKIRDSSEFQDVVAAKYEGYGKDKEGPGRQIWHTPTELFRVSVVFIPTFFVSRLI